MGDLPFREEVMEGSISEADAAREARRSLKQRRRKEGMLGWLFVSPVLILLTVFLIIPILLALYVSFTLLQQGRGGWPQELQRSARH
jgi:hypothetical protein